MDNPNITKQKEPVKKVTIHFPESTHARVRAIADRERRSFKDQILYWCDQKISEYDGIDDMSKKGDIESGARAAQ